MSKKISFLSVFNPYRGGIAQFSDELLLALKKEAHVNAYNFKRQYPSVLFPGKTQETTSLREGVNAVKVLDSINPLSYYDTRKRLKSDDSEIVLSSFWLPFFGPALGTALKGVSKRKVALLHNVTPHESRFMDESFTKYYLDQNDDFVVLSETVKRQLLAFKPDANVISLFHPLYQQFGEKQDQKLAQKKLGIKEGQKVILFFGFIREYKGLDILIDAMADLGEKYTLLIAGESYSDFSVYEKQISTQGSLTNVVQHVRYIEDSEVSDFFSAADICALPYKSATQSGIASIAKSFELPIVATNVGELSKEFQDGKTGVLCERVDPKSFADALRTCSNRIDELQSNIRKENQSKDFTSFAKELLGALA